MTVADHVTPFPPRTCVVCRAAVTTRFCVACGADAGGAKLPLMHVSSAAAALMHRVNFGAGGAPGFWTFAHGSPVLGTLYWLFWFPLPPVSLGIAIFLFLNGNRVALQRRRYADPQEFAAVEGAWAVAGTILILPTIAATLLWAGMILYILASAGAAK
jgi:hypothetical protein